MKKCSQCKLLKEKSSFNKNKKRKDGLQTICRACSSKNSKRYYSNFTEEHREKTKKRRSLKRKEIKSKIDEIKKICSCAKCGENDIVCLEFHHVDPKAKDFDIASSYAYEWKWEIILEEIKKCVCLCASCHRKFHHSRFQLEPEMMCVFRIAGIFEQ